MALSIVQAGAVLGSLPISETLTTALEAAAARLANSIRDELNNPPGGPHGMPWLHTGTLSDSIAHSVDGLDAMVGSNDPAAAPQELGTATTQPRPFLAPTAEALGEEIARDIGAALAGIISRGRP